MQTAPLRPSVELPWSHETLCWTGETHANCATGTFAGAPSRATKRCAGSGRRMRTAPLRPS
eukprot:6110051-Pyramimonas_sp.AAC.1